MERERAERGYTVHELAALSGCTVRTLHHYDELGLVRAGRAANGYRRYGPAEVDRLQQVLLYREAEMPLADIKRLLDDPAFDAREALAGHLRELHARKERLDGLIASVEKTLASMEGDDPMKDEEKFEAFKQGLVDENEKKYGKEVRERWGGRCRRREQREAYGHDRRAVPRHAEAGAGDQGRPRGGDGDGRPGKRGSAPCGRPAPPVAVPFLEGRHVLEGRACGPRRDVRGRRALQGLLRGMGPGAAEFLRDAIKAF